VSGRLAALALASLLLAGCGTLTPRPGQGLPPQAYVETPFFAQEIHHCGPAALAGVLGAAGVTTTPEALAPQVYLPGREGSLQLELLAAARAAGRLAYVLEPNLEAALREVAAGRPVLVLQNLGLSWYPRWHYALLIGYDLPTGRVTLHSGTRRDYVTSLATFDRTWARAGRWGVLVLPPGTLPVTVRELPYLAAAAALERGDPVAAEAAYAAALQRWPASLPARLGRGNARYARGDLHGAAQDFAAAAAAHPDSAIAHNNHAHVLYRLGRHDEALAAARRAVALAGDGLPEARRTLEEIQGAVP
jgi:tetratricopeptide (TPR) repeat protein